jgi:hypothetical protein
LNVNKENGSTTASFRRSFLVGTGVATALALTAACSGGSTYYYGIRGVVEDAVISYDCPRNLSMEPVSFDAGHGRGSGPASSTGRSRKGSDNSSKANSGSQDRKTRSPRPQNGATKQGSTEGAKKAPASKAPASKGVALSEKPEKPERVNRVPSAQSALARRGCKVDDYELFIRNKNGLYEQDVRRTDYKKCTNKARMSFPACTTI